MSHPNVQEDSVIEKSHNVEVGDRGLLPRAGRPFLALTFLCAAAATGRSQEPATSQVATQIEGPTQVEGVRAALEKRLQVEGLLSKEKSDWLLGRQMLQDRIELVGREIEGLRARIAELDKNVADTEAKTAELGQRSAHLEANRAVLQASVQPLEARLLALLPKLPETIRERIEPLSRRVPRGEANETVPSLGKRFESLVGVLNEVNRFQGEVTATSEVRELPNGERVEVTTLWFGLGQAYFAGPDGKVAGQGLPAAEGWTWVTVNEPTAASEITRAIAIYRKQGVADFVRLPVRLQGDGR